MSRFQLRTVRGYGFGEVSSAMQKAIRRADVQLAGYWALELWSSGFGNYVWKRLLTISAEDCFGLITQEIKVAARFVTTGEQGIVSHRRKRSHLHQQGRDRAFAGEEEPGRRSFAELRLRPVQGDRRGQARRRSAQSAQVCSDPRLRLRLPHGRRAKEGPDEGEVFPG